MRQLGQFVFASVVLASGSVVGVMAAPADGVASLPAVAALEGDAPTSGVSEATLTIAADALGHVEVRASTQRRFEDAGDGQSLHEGDAVRTDADGAAEITYPGGSATALGADTKIVIRQLTEVDGTLAVIVAVRTGATATRFVATGAGESFRQESGLATLTSDGGVFQTYRTPDHQATRVRTGPDTLVMARHRGARHRVVDARHAQISSGTGGVATGLYVHVIDGTINLANGGGSLNFAAGQFGYTPSFVQPPVVLPANPGILFTPPPAFTSPSRPTPAQATAPDTVRTAPRAPAPTFGLPGAPTSVSATAGDAHATVSWSPPTNDGGAPITKYTVTSTPGLQTCATTGALSCVVTGLTNGTTYGFRVVATNSVGDGPPSGASGATTPAVPPLAFTSPDSTFVHEAAPFSFMVTTTGPPTRTIDMAGGPLPSGVTFTDHGDGTATFTGPPDPGTAGAGSTEYTLLLTVSNPAGDHASQTFTLIVGVP